MAIIKMGTLVSGVRGTVGGVCFSGGVGGSYVKLWSQSTKPRTPAQTKVRNNLGRIPALWRTLDPADQADWGTWAALPTQTRQNSLGDDYNATGFNWFAGLSLNLFRAGRSAILTAPLLARPVAPVLDAFNFGPGGVPFTCEIEYDPAQFSSSIDIIIEAAYKPGGGLLANYLGWRVIIAGLAHPSGTYPIPLIWLDRFGSPGLGGQGWIRIYRQNLEGYRSSADELVTVYA